ncbi:translocation protein [Coniophora puteana RWD-64-598 SS2]|uniref:Translocation protein SEC62 n=1 Tax=Coniophora puteana (strain RWD-64-598) TaxID=741705 RepID=A0A5M3MIQ3_CONPW|nr:translocation protein [Coniophora puteana RWD-64-598 SS2]EIW78501.1 translocation protein [Coniophora puteana RWD-64-598 SS2]
MSTAERQASAPQDIKNVVSFLRSSKAGIKIRVGALNGKRVDYFKGKTAAKALQSPAYAKLKNVPPVTSDEDASKLLQSVIPFTFFLRVERGSPSGSAASSPRVLQVLPQQAFAPEGYYAWFYEGSQWTTYAGGLLMVAVMLAGVMFPLWPPIMRLGVWYLSVAMLGLVGAFFVLAIVRLVFYIVTLVVASPGIWMFPNLFADVGVIESFVPGWEWDIPKKKVKKSRKGKAPAGNTPEEKLASNGGAFIEEVDTPDSSRPVSRAGRAARVEEVPDEDS